MKVRSLIFLLSMLLSAGMFAQSSSPVNAGIKAGANYSTLIARTEICLQITVWVM
jgi:hypothetical protein